MKTEKEKIINLSSKRELNICKSNPAYRTYCYNEKDVKEFIRQIMKFKSEATEFIIIRKGILERLAGDKLK